MTNENTFTIDLPNKLPATFVEQKDGTDILAKHSASNWFFKVLYDADDGPFSAFLCASENFPGCNREETKLLESMLLAHYENREWERLISR